MSDDLRQSDFVTQAAGARPGLISELIAFMRQHKKWWIAPIVLFVLIFGALVVLGGTAAAPFIYTLF